MDSNQTDNKTIVAEERMSTLPCFRVVERHRRGSYADRVSIAVVQCFPVECYITGPYLPEVLQVERTTRLRAGDFG